jgi:hypothetical protein
MITSSITLHSAFNQLRANLAGKFLTCFFRPLLGATLPPGKYKISSPMHNSVYGTFALLSAAGPAAGVAGHKDWLSAAGPAAGVAGHKDWLSAAGPAVGLADHKDWVTRSDWIEFSINQSGVFVLVARPLAGRNGIVITSGFAELMAALQQAGGATVTVV